LPDSVVLQNHFAVAGVGELYTAGRPYVHDAAAREICRHAGYSRTAVDVGAGTGLSARALLRCADTIVGVEPSGEMIGAAFRHRAIRYVAGCGEDIPLTSDSCDLATVGAAYHWCDRDALFGELTRVVRRDGWVAIYDIELVKVAESPMLLDWLRAEYWSRLPWCPHHHDFDARTHVRPPFALVTDVVLHEVVPMTLDTAVSFVLSQASSINAVAVGSDSRDALQDRLRRGFQSHFPRGGAAAVGFDLPLALLRKTR